MTSRGCRLPCPRYVDIVCYSWTAGAHAHSHGYAWIALRPRIWDSLYGVIEGGAEHVDPHDITGSSRRLLPPSPARREEIAGRGDGVAMAIRQNAMYTRRNEI